MRWAGCPTTGPCQIPALKDHQVPQTHTKANKRKADLKNKAASATFLSGHHRKWHCLEDFNSQITTKQIYQFVKNIGQDCMCGHIRTMKFQVEHIFSVKVKWDSRATTSMTSSHVCYLLTLVLNVTSVTKVASLCHAVKNGKHVYPLMWTVTQRPIGESTNVATTLKRPAKNCTRKRTSLKGNFTLEKAKERGGCPGGVVCCSNKGTLLPRLQYTWCSKAWYERSACWQKLFKFP